MSNFSQIIAGASGILGGLGSVIAGNSANKTNLQIARETNQAQMDLAKYQADQNLNLWNLNNEYNSPANQVERLKKAGINPNLAFGSGANAGNSSSPAVGFQAPSLQRSEVDNRYVVSASQMAMQGLSMMADIEKKGAETSLIRQNIINAEQDKQLKDLTAIRMQLENEKSEVGREFWWSEYQSKLAQLDSQAVLNNANAWKSDTQRFALEAQLPFLQEMYRSQIDNTLSQISLNKSTKHGVDIENSMKRSLLSAKISSLLANAQLASSQTQQVNLANEVKTLLIDSGLDIQSDEFDRMLYSNMRGKSGGKAMNAVAKTILSFLSTLIH